MPRKQRPSQGRNLILKITEESTCQVQRNLLRILAVTSASWSLGNGKRTLCSTPTRTAQNTFVQSRHLRSNNPADQEKAIVYNELVANAVALQNVVHQMLAAV